MSKDSPYKAKNELSSHMGLDGSGSHGQCPDAILRASFAEGGSACNPHKTRRDEFAGGGLAKGLTAGLGAAAAGLGAYALHRRNQRSKESVDDMRKREYANGKERNEEGQKSLHHDRLSDAYKGFDKNRELGQMKGTEGTRNRPELEAKAKNFSRRTVSAGNGGDLDGTGGVPGTRDRGTLEKKATQNLGRTMRADHPAHQLDPHEGSEKLPLYKRGGQPRKPALKGFKPYETNELMSKPGRMSNRSKKY